MIFQYDDANFAELKRIMNTSWKGIWKYYGIGLDNKKRKFSWWTNSAKQYKDLKFARGRYKRHKILMSNKK